MNKSAFRKVSGTLIQKVQFSSVTQSCLTLCNPWTAARQASLSITNLQRLPKLMSIELVMPSNHLILCRCLLLPPSIFPSIRVFSNESALHIKWSKYWSFSFSISPSNDYSGFISFRIDWFDLLAIQGLSRVFSNTTVQKHQFFSPQLSLQSSSHIHSPLNCKGGYNMRKVPHITIVVQLSECKLIGKEG